MAKLSRRKFLLLGGAVVGGGLVLGYSALPRQYKDVADIAKGDGQGPILATWLRLDPDNTLTVIVPHSEMGQGVHTALPMMAAEELDADWNLVRMEQAPATPEFANQPMGEGFITNGIKFPDFLAGTVDLAFYQAAKALNLQVTGGSTSVRFTGHYGMRVAGAGLREMLIKAAAKRWNVPSGQLIARDSHILHEASGQSATFGELANEAAAYTPSPTPTLKDPKDYKIVGTSVPRYDIPSKVDGSAQYGIDVQVPGMLYAAIHMSPVFGGTVVSIDASKAEAMPGVKTVVDLGNAVAVVADKYWRARTALQAVDVRFDNKGNDKMSSDVIFERFEAAIQAGDSDGDETHGDAEAALASADKRVDAAYRVPFLAHAPMEPMNCTAWLHDGQCEIWTGTQNPLGARAVAAEVAGIDADNVTVHNVMLGGGFGRRIHVNFESGERQLNDFVSPAVTVAKAVNAPVKLVWSREDDIQHDAYRPAIVSHFSGAVDGDGKASAWRNIYNNKHDPTEASLIPYSIENVDIRNVKTEAYVPFGPWRSVAHSHHAFFTESFVDELAHAAGEDPMDFRIAMLDKAPRHKKVLEVLRDKAWSEPVVPGRARGVAIHESFQSIVGEVAEISLGETGDLKVHKVVCAVDCGSVVNPDTLIAQMESGIIFGLSAALYGEITLEKGRVVQENFPDYDMVRLAQAPEIETHIVESGAPLGGAGEPGTPPIAPAVANAVFALTGKRMRALPLRNQDVPVA